MHWGSASVERTVLADLGSDHRFYVLHHMSWPRLANIDLHREEFVVGQPDEVDAECSQTPSFASFFPACSTVAMMPGRQLDVPFGAACQTRATLWYAAAGNDRGTSPSTASVPPIRVSAKVEPIDGRRGRPGNVPGG
jgi:hypothetical protein